MKMCRCCGQPVPFPGVYLTEARRKVLVTIVSNLGGIYNMVDLAQSVYPRRAISPHTVSVHLHHLRQNLLESDWKIINKPYRVVNKITGRVATFSMLGATPIAGTSE